MRFAHPLRAFHVTPSLNPSPRGRDLLSLQAVKKSGVSQMRNLSYSISLPKASTQRRLSGSTQTTIMPSVVSKTVCPMLGA